MSSEQEPEVAAPAPPAEESIEKPEETPAPAEVPKEEPVTAEPVEEPASTEQPEATEKEDEKIEKDEKPVVEKVEEAIDQLAAKTSELEVAA